MLSLDFCFQLSKDLRFYQDESAATTLGAPKPPPANLPTMAEHHNTRSIKGCSPLPRPAGSAPAPVVRAHGRIYMACARALSPHQVRNDEDEFAYIEWFCQMRLITSDKRALSILGSRKRGESQCRNPLASRLLSA